MKALKILAMVLLIYAGVVIAFESSIGYLQPSGGSTLVITTFDADGAAHERVVSRLESGGQLYVATNHWPRSWYRRALAHADVQLTIAGKRGDYRAVSVAGAEHERVDRDNHLPWVFRILTGFPPRHFLRLETR